MIVTEKVACRMKAKAEKAPRGMSRASWEAWREKGMEDGSDLAKSVLRGLKYDEAETTYLVYSDDCFHDLMFACGEEDLLDREEGTNGEVSCLVEVEMEEIPLGKAWENCDWRELDAWCDPRGVWSMSHEGRKAWISSLGTYLRGCTHLVWRDGVLVDIA